LTGASTLRGISLRSLSQSYPTLAEDRLTDTASLHSLSLPSLDWVEKNLTITAGNPLAVEIPELGYAKVIRLSGKIRRYKPLIRFNAQSSFC
jgi:hypothetical protein